MEAVDVKLTKTKRNHTVVKLFSSVPPALQVDPALYLVQVEADGRSGREQIDTVEKQQKVLFWLLDPRNVPAFLPACLL